MFISDVLASLIRLVPFSLTSRLVLSGLTARRRSFDLSDLSVDACKFDVLVSFNRLAPFSLTSRLVRSGPTSRRSDLAVGACNNQPANEPTKQTNIYINILRSQIFQWRIPRAPTTQHVDGLSACASVVTCRGSCRHVSVQ